MGRVQLLVFFAIVGCAWARHKEKFLCGSRFELPSGDQDKLKFQVIGTELLNTSTPSNASKTVCDVEFVAKDGYYLSLVWRNFRVAGFLNECDQDAVAVKVGLNRTLLGRFCSSNFPFFLSSTVDTMPDLYLQDSVVVSFELSGPGSKSGFDLKVKAETKSQLLRHDTSFSSCDFQCGSSFSNQWPQKSTSHHETLTITRLSYASATNVFINQFSPGSKGAPCTENADRLYLIGTNVNNLTLPEHVDSRNAVCVPQAPFLATFTEKYVVVMWVPVKQRDERDHGSYFLSYLMSSMPVKNECTANRSAVFDVYPPNEGTYSWCAPSGNSYNVVCKDGTRCKCMGSNQTEADACEAFIKSVNYDRSVQLTKMAKQLPMWVPLLLAVVFVSMFVVTFVAICMYRQRTARKGHSLVAQADADA